MENTKNDTLVALRDFFLARSREDLRAACLELAGSGDVEPSPRAWDEGDWDAAEFAFNKLFVGPAELRTPPYASCYLEPEPQLMGQSTLRVRRLYEMAGLVSPLHGQLPCDHLGVELDAALGILTLVERTAAEEPRALWRYFLEDHLAVWLPSFLARARGATAGHPAVDLALDRLEAWLDAQASAEKGDWT